MQFKLRRLTLGLLIGIIIFLGAETFSVHAEDNSALFVKAKADLFHQAMDVFSAKTAIEAATFWAEGVKSRNGVLQYAMMDEKLKKSFSQAMERERPSWVTGFSSPWVKAYEVVEKRGAGWRKCRITVKFDLASSMGDEGSGQAVLLIAKEGRRWVIRDIERGPNLMGF